MSSSNAPPEDTASLEHEVYLVYDRQCPVCDLYCSNVDVGAAHGRLVRLDARDGGDIVDEVTALGLDIDEGMVLKVGERLYYGPEAIHELALMSSGKGLFNATTRRFFGSRKVADAVYPLMKALRNLLLKMLGRSRINNLEIPGRTRF